MYYVFVLWEISLCVEILYQNSIVSIPESIVLLDESMCMLLLDCYRMLLLLSNQSNRIKSNQIKPNRNEPNRTNSCTVVGRIVCVLNIVGSKRIGLPIFCRRVDAVSSSSSSSSSSFLFSFFLLVTLFYNYLI